MTQDQTGCNVQQHLDTILNTVYVLGFMEEALTTLSSFSRQGGIGMEVVVREYRQKLKHSSDFLRDYIMELQGAS